MEYVLLANPGHNRVYLDAAKGAAVAELCRLLPGCRVEEAVLCGQPAFRLMCEQPLNQQELDACAKSSLFYALFEQFPPLWPALSSHPFAAALVGAAFVGTGVGLCVGAGGAPGGDDALAMSISHKTGWRLQWIYLASDLLVLGLSTTYLDTERLGMSLLTVVLSGQLVGWVDTAVKRLIPSLRE